ncbi:MAG: copper homeostasis protein CutC [Eubacterium sp.]
MIEKNIYPSKHSTKENFPTPILEACIDSVESAIAAARGGADRFELCSNLIIGGTTPSGALIKEIRKVTNIPIRVLIRPRFGDFCYTDYEFAIMNEEVKKFRQLGADGVVIGILNPDGQLDMDRMKTLIEQAGDMHVTLHRAFDVCRNPYDVLEQSKVLGIDTILTSGQENHCMEGKELLKKLVQQAGDDVEIMIGSGVNAEVISQLASYTGAHAFHMSGKKEIESSMSYRNENVSMGLPVMSEYTIWRTAEEEIRKAYIALHGKKE